MAPRTRYFLIGSALVVVVGLCTGLVAYYNDTLPRRAAMSEFAYLPEDASAVAFADVRDIMDSEFRQRLRQMLPTGDDKERLQAETGIDIERDIDTVVAALGAGDPSHGGLVLLRGRFDQTRIEALAAQHGAIPDDYKNIRVLSSREAIGVPGSGAGAGRTPSIAFVEPGLLALGDVASLHRAIDAAGAQTGMTANDALMKTVAGVQGSGNAWIVGHTSTLMQHPGLPDQVRDQLSNVEWIALSADIDRGIRAMLRAEARDDKSGADLRAVINGAVAAARMVAGDDARVGNALNSVQAAGSGRTVEVSFTAPAELLDMMHPGGMVPNPAPAR